MTRFWCQASRICANTRASMSSLRSMPRISAPSAKDSGRTPSAGGGDLISLGAVSILLLHPAWSAPWWARCNYDPRGNRRSRLLGVDEDESDAAGFGAAIDPGVIGALLHQHVTGFEMNFRIIEQHVDLAGHDDGVVHGARAMHGRMPRRQSALGRPIAEAAMHGVVVEPARLGRFRREIDDAKHGAAARWHDADVDCGAVGAAGKIGRCL